MHIPRAGERVYVNERGALFIVARVYHETQTADLLPTVGSRPVEEDFPWQKLFRCRPSHAETINATPGLRH